MLETLACLKNRLCHRLLKKSFTTLLFVVVVNFHCFLVKYKRFAKVMGRWVEVGVGIYEAGIESATVGH